MDLIYYIKDATFMKHEGRLHLGIKNKSTLSFCTSLGLRYLYETWR